MSHLFAIYVTFILLVFFALKKNIFDVFAKKTFRHLIDRVNIGYYRYRVSDGVVLDANRGFVKILELDTDPMHVVGQPVRELFIYAEEKEGAIREQLLSKGRIRNYEYHFKTLDGKDKWVLHNSHIVKSLFGIRREVEAVVEDITEEKLSYERMRESQERYETLFRFSGDMVIICGMDGFLIEEVNPVAEKITGFTSEELIGMPLEKLFHPSGRKAITDAREDLMFRRGAKVEEMVVGKDGVYREALVTLTAVDLGEERVVMAVVKDVSSMAKELEEQRRRQNELEEFRKASILREERIAQLRDELRAAKQQIEAMKKKA